MSEVSRNFPYSQTFVVDFLSLLTCVFKRNRGASKLSCHPWDVSSDEHSHGCALAAKKGKIENSFC